MGARLDETLPLFQSAAGITEQYSRWLKESFVFLTELALAPEKTDLGQVWEEWERKRDLAAPERHEGACQIGRRDIACASRHFNR